MNLRPFGSLLTASAMRSRRRSLPLKPNARSFAPQSIGSSDLKNQTVEPQDDADKVFPAKPFLQAEANPEPPQRGDRDAVVGEANAVVPKTTLRQARAQFEYLAKEFIPLGDIASQVMCELGAYTMDLALTAGQKIDHFPVDEVAFRLLAPSAPVSPRAGSDSPPAAQPSTVFTRASSSSP